MSLDRLISLHAKGFLPNIEECQFPHDCHILLSGPDKVVSFAAFHEQGLALLTHHFLCSLLLYYHIELHHPAPGGIIHITTFTMMYEALMGIQPLLSLWKDFFHARAWMKQLLAVRGVVLQMQNRRSG
jgi:hypothetical protein